MKKIKIVSIIVVLIILLLNISTFSEAYSGGTRTTSVSGGISNFDPDFYKPNDLTEKDYKTVFEKVGTIISTIRIIGTVVSVIMVMILGIKYMLGSIEEKAEYKKTMMPMLIGAILLFGTTTIISIIYELVSNANASI